MSQRKIQLCSQQYYHIYNRGHNKNALFLQSSDYSRYLQRLQQYLEKHQVTILAYCLMPNHVHFLIRQDGEEAIQQFIHRLHTAYTMYFNKKYERVGAVFQGRFKARMIDREEYLLHVSRYIHQNPIDILASNQPRSPRCEAGRLGGGRALKLKDYIWSSYRYYVNSKLPSPICDTSILLNYFSKRNEKFSYQHFVEDGLKELKKDKERIEKLNNGDF